MSWADERARFPVLREHAYLNTGSVGPLARETLTAMETVRAWEAENGRAGSAYFEEMLARRERVRALIAELVSVPADRLALTSSSTQGVQIVVVGLGLGPGDEVVTTDVEHFGLTGPLLGARADLRIARVRERPASEFFDLLRDLVTPRTRLIALSAVSWLDGKVFPWRELREATGVPILVDGAQSVGAIQADAADANFYTISAQKWLCGPDACGALYIRDPDMLEHRLVAYPAAADYDIGAGTWEPKPGALGFDPGFAPATSLAGLEAALSIQPAGRLERARELADHFGDGLREAGLTVVSEPRQSTLVSFRAPGEPTEVVTRLYEQGVIVRDLPHTDYIRASVGWWNDERDLARLVAGLGTL
jgi:L-cysteine/cystine lyase